MSSEIKSNGLSPDAIEMLGQLYAKGPTWDGNVCSKQGRSELCRAGLAWHAHGYAQLTQEGVELAAEWDINDPQLRANPSWFKKRRDS